MAHRRSRASLTIPPPYIIYAMSLLARESLVFRLFRFVRVRVATAADGLIRTGDSFLRLLPCFASVRKLKAWHAVQQNFM